MLKRIVTMAGVCALCLTASQSSMFAQKEVVSEVTLDQPASGPAIVAVDPDDTVWIALAKSGKLAKYVNGRVKTYQLGAEARPVGVAIGTKENGFPGDIWIAASYDNKILRFNTATEEVEEFPIDGNDSWPFNIAIGPDHTIWFTERAAGRVGMLKPGTHEISHFMPPTKSGGPAGLAVDLTAKRVWFSESYADRIGMLDITSGVIHEYKMSDASTGLTTGPAGVALDRAGHVWFGKLEGKLGTLDPATGNIVIKDVPWSAGRPAGIAVGANNEVWLVSLDGNAVIHYSPSTDKFSKVDLPTGSPDEKPSTPPFARSSRPFGIAIDHEGNVWVSEQYTGKLGRVRAGVEAAKLISPSGVVRFPNPLLSYTFNGPISADDSRVVSIDGRPQTVQHGHVDLKGMKPGEHIIAVTFQAKDGGFIQQVQTQTVFTFEPNKQAIVQMLRDLTPSSAQGKKEQDVLIERAIAVVKDGSNGNIRALHDEMAAGASRVGIKDSGSWLEAIDLQYPHAEHDASVSILDAEPYFSPSLVLLQKGGTVVWRYDPPSDGHSISKEQHTLMVENKGIRSSALHAGEAYPIQFPDVGTYVVKDLHSGAAQAVVRVSP